MNISDEQYEDMQRRIDELTAVLGFLMIGKEIVIYQECMKQFVEVYKTFGVEILWADDGVRVRMIQPNE